MMKCPRAYARLTLAWIVRWIAATGPSPSRASERGPSTCLRASKRTTANRSGQLDDDRPAVASRSPAPGQRHDHRVLIDGVLGPVVELALGVDREALGQGLAGDQPPQLLARERGEQL